MPLFTNSFDADQPLSSLIRDLCVRAAFERTERDQGFAFAVSPAPAPELDGGAAEQIKEVEYA
jgi:hypothetical protein